MKNRVTRIIADEYEQSRYLYAKAVTNIISYKSLAVLHAT